MMTRSGGPRQEQQKSADNASEGGAEVSVLDRVRQFRGQRTALTRLLEQLDQRLATVGAEGATESGGTGEGDTVVSSGPREGLGAAANRSSAVGRRGTPPQQYGVSSKGLLGVALGAAHDTSRGMDPRSKLDYEYTVDYGVGYGLRSGVSGVRDCREFDNPYNSLGRLLGGGVGIPYQLPSDARRVRSEWGLAGT